MVGEPKRFKVWSPAGKINNMLVHSVHHKSSPKHTPPPLPGGLISFQELLLKFQGGGA